MRVVYGVLLPVVVAFAWLHQYLCRLRPSDRDLTDNHSKFELQKCDCGSPPWKPTAVIDYFLNPGVILFVGVNFEMPTHINRLVTGGWELSNMLTNSAAVPCLISA